MRVKRRIISCLLAMCMVFNLCTIGFSEANSLIQPEKVEMAKKFIEASGYDIGDYIVMCDAVPLYEVDDTETVSVPGVYYYFILDGDVLIGLMNEVYHDGESVLGYFPLAENQSDGVDVKDSDVAIMINDKTTYIVVDDVLIPVFGISDTANEKSLCTGIESVAEPLKGREIIPTSTFNGRTANATVYSQTLDVPLVPNTTDPVMHNGLCWAACVAMQYNYRTGENLQAHTVWSVLSAKYGTPPEGTLEWYRRAYPTYDMNNMTYLESGLDSSDIAQCLNAGKPIQISLDNNSSGHAVIISGMTVYSNGTGIYYINDPNASAVYLQSVSSAAMSNYLAFVYANYPLYGTSPWTNWDLSIY